jgi:phenylacetate-CoA ligase
MGECMGSINKLRLLHQVRKNQWLKTSELEELQAKKLRAIIKHAYENTEFYHRKFQDAGIRPDDIKTLEDLRKVPFTTKSELKKYSLGPMLANGVNLKKCRVVPTSGSTGTPLKVAYDEAADDFSRVVNLRSMMENGLRFRDKWVNIGDARTAGNPRWFQKFGFFNLITLNLFSEIKEQIDTLIHLKPDVIIGYPSQLNLISWYVRKYSIKQIQPRIIFSTAELLNDKTREFINSVFNLQVVDLFGCIEVNRTAWECCEHKGYHLDIDAVATEFIRDGNPVSKGDSGELVYTSLYNYAMPLIRYKIGDIGVESDETCPCGRGLPLMKGIEGRKDDVICLPSGRDISPITLALVMKHSENIIEYQIIQDTFDRISLYLVISEGFTDRDIEKLRSNIQMALNNEVSVEIKIQDKIKTGSNGKIRSVISMIKRS